MKLKEGFILHDAGGEHIVVAIGKAGESFNGLIRNNATAQFIYEQLLEETTEENIVEAMKKKYDAPEEVIRKDVQNVITQLRASGIIDE